MSGGAAIPPLREVEETGMSIATATAEAPAGHAGLSWEHAELLREVHARARGVRDALPAQQWPVALGRLVGYLRYEVLDQAVHEERLLYPLSTEGRRSDPRLVQLAQDHVRVRDLTDALAHRAETGDQRDIRELLAALTGTLEQHLADEEDVLSGTSDAGVAAMRQPVRRHEWFPLTEGPVLEMDRLPLGFAVPAVVERLARMRVAERLEIRSGRPLEPLSMALVRRGMSGDFGWSYLHEGPEVWAATITRRAPSE
jgi:uncharacterized protein (DUF2249 family)